MAAIFNRKENATDKYPIINDPNTFILSTIPIGKEATNKTVSGCRTKGEFIM